MKKNKEKKKRGCLIPSLIFIQVSLLLLLGIYFFTPRLKEVSVSADITQTYDINKQVKITLKTVPENFKIPDSAFKTSGGKLNFDNDQITFTSSKPGKFNIRVAFSGISSNKITLKFEDKKAIEQAEQERIEQEQAEQERIAQEQAEQERIAQEQAEQARIAQEQAEQARIAQEQQNPTNNFNKYNNPSQQQTTDNYVLNTNTMKFHYPSCRDVKKIAPENYATSNGTKSDIESQGYTACKHCNPH